LSTEEFIAAAMDHALGTETGDFRITNKAYDRILAAREQLRVLPDGGRGCLREMLSNPEPGVRLWSACYLLPTDPVEAESTLVSLAQEKGLVGFDAEMTLKEWRAGRLTFT